ncbi:UNVERIFIED_CONTAM: hypothetical protein Sradi_1650200 [Sesamum radiatum]|uniref:DNA-directed RNA polymerase III subunit RPC9 n=1 Tax=Sesamum radiatum TaxID=300843 RepID=A0AAW2UC57_SESRA
MGGSGLWPKPGPIHYFACIAQPTIRDFEHNAGALTNFEVLDLLKSRGAGKDPTRVIASVSPSEFKVFDYLEQTPACNQTRDIIHKFVDECKKFDLAKAEILNVANMRPSSAVEVYTIIEECDSRMEEKIDDFVEMILQVLPPHPSQAEPNKESGEAKEETVQ